MRVSPLLRTYYPGLGHTLVLACNVTADPPPDLNWQRGRTVLSHHDHREQSNIMAGILNLTDLSWNLKLLARGREGLKDIHCDV